MKRLIALLLLLGLAPFSTAALVTDGLVIHLDAGLLALNDGDAVTSWADSQSAGTDPILTTVTGIDTPIFKTNIVNGLPVVRFSGNDILCSGTFPWAATATTTIFTVFTGGQTGLKTERAVHLGSSTGVAAKTIAIEASSNINDTDGGSGLRFNNGKMLVKTENPLDTGFHVGAYQIAQGAQYQSAFYAVDGAVQTFDSMAGATNLLTLPATGNVLALGDGLQTSAWLTGDYYTGDIAELLIYNAVLTTAQIDEVNAYLMGKYAIPEPATLVLLGLGSLVAIRCRKA